MTSEMLVSFGGALKSLGAGRFGGFLVIYSDEHSPDLTGDFFTKATEFFVDDGARLPILYDHGFDPDLKRQKIGMGTLTKKNEGLWLEFQLDRRAKYVGAIEKMCADGKCGLSSGAAGHLVSRQAFKKASWVAEWGLAEGSITPEPAEPRTTVMPLKSYAESRKFIPIEDPEEDDVDPEGILPVKTTSLAARLTRFIDDSVDDGKSRDEVVKRLAREALMDAMDVEKVLSGEQRPSTARLKAFARALELPFETLKALAQNAEPTTIKGMFEDELANQQPGIWMLWDVFRCVVRRIADAKASTQAAATEFDAGPKIDEAVDEFVSRLKASVVTQVADYAANDEDEFYLKTFDLSSPEIFRSVTEGISMDEHLRLVGTAEEDLLARFEANANRPRGKSYKAGRELSNKNRQRLTKLQQMHKEHHDTVAGKIQELLDATMPKANPTEKNAALARNLLLRHERRQQLGA